MDIECPDLLDYQQWKKANNPNKFSLYDYLHGVTKTKGLNPDLYVAFLKLFWPDFVSVDEYVFLLEKYDEQKYYELVKQRYQGSDLEYWMNLLNLDGFFQEVVGQEGDYLDHCLFLGEHIAKLWAQKLGIEFPDKVFDVRCIHDSDLNEVYVVFCQKND
jgi:hypothetical protein